ncbi:hypothetical protein PGT21_008350 [Puccinia graminis f. sp. tritici]|uniref:Uncharacterized protein n=1 Tax=Puccinia graminis f. sp. tritici TaxID=56615 RepID=A0A5B0NKL6_PUCGR|nr:hypothetical protein PGT21_008350 [Puccinia graminis f. sp. tritici]
MKGAISRASVGELKFEAGVGFERGRVLLFALMQVHSETACLPPTKLKQKFQRPAAGPRKRSSTLSTELHQAKLITEFSHDFRLLHKSRAVIKSLLRRLSWASVDPRPMGTS